MRKIIVVVILIFLGFSVNAYAEETFLNFPTIINKINLGISHFDFKIIMPESQVITNNESTKLLASFFKNNELWNSAMFYFENETLKYFVVSKLRLDEGTDNFGISKYVPNILRGLISKYGGNISKSIIEETGTGKKYYEPLIIWNTSKMIIYFSYTPENVVNTTKAVNISVGFSIPNIEFSKYYPNIVSNATVNFDDLLSDEVKQILSQPSQTLQK